MVLELADLRHVPGALARSTPVVAILCLLLATNATASVRQAPPGWVPPAKPGLQSPPSYVVMLVLDGALPSYLRLGSFPHLQELIRGGMTYGNAWDGMLESETPTGHASLGTGSLPRRHGIISFSWVTDANVSQQPTNPIPIQQGQLEHILRQSGVPSIASSLKRQDPRSLVVVTSGHKDYAVDAVGGWAADYLMFYSERGQIWTPMAIPRHVPPQSVMQAPGLTAYAPHMSAGDQDTLAVRLALSAFHQLRQRVTIVNLPEFDWPLGHLRGGPADRNFGWQLMNRLDSDLASIEWELQQDHVLNKTLFVLTADHGMIALKHLIPHNTIQDAVAAAGTTLENYEFHTGGYLWLQNRAKGPEVAAKLLQLHNPYIRAVYYRLPHSMTYQRASGGPQLASPGVDSAYRFLLGTFAGASAPQVAIFLAEGASIRGRNQTNWRGDHGGPSWGAEHIPLILSGPGVRRGATSAYPATIYDIAPTILRLLGASPNGMDGVVLADGLTTPADGDIAVQHGRDLQLSPMVQALKLQSKQAVR